MFLAVSTLRKASSIAGCTWSGNLRRAWTPSHWRGRLLGVHGRTQRTNRNERDQAQATLLAGFTLQILSPIFK